MFRFFVESITIQKFQMNIYIEFGVEPNNNTVHQQFNQFVESTGQLLQHNQLSQSPLNYFYPESANYSQKMTSQTTIQMALENQRPIIIDGLNIGYAHGRNKTFSAKGIILCSKYFTRRGFLSVKIMLPQHYRGKPGTNTYDILNLVIDNIYFTPSRKIQDDRLTCYTDRILLDHAINCGGVVVSNDNFRDLYAENIKYRDVIENRHIMLMFIEDEIIIPSDQYGPRYPNLDAHSILHYPA